jgi:hypothetical protein
MNIDDLDKGELVDFLLGECGEDSGNTDFDRMEIKELKEYILRHHRIRLEGFGIECQLKED